MGMVCWDLELRIKRFFSCVIRIFYNFAAECECSSVGRASASQAEGRGFEPRYSLGIDSTFYCRDAKFCVSTCFIASLPFYGIPAFVGHATGVPHSGQNFPVTSVPHFGHFFGASSAGIGVPHSGQNLPVVSVPHLGHFLVFLGAGAGVPHSGQNLPVMGVPQLGQGIPWTCGAA